MNKMPQTIWTIGHSTHPVDDFIAMLKAFAVQTLVDIRTIPQSRYNPQFGQDPLAASLKGADITYMYMKNLGGLRHAQKDSPNGGWRNKGFRGYADYMQTAVFKDALNDLITLSKTSRTAIMCAEAVPWQCHRSLVADALIIRGIGVEDIMSATKATPHHLTKFAKVTGEDILYPPEESAQTSLF